jgi:hypothetical protein
VLRQVLRDEENTYGQLLAEFVRGGRPIEVGERDDGAVFAGSVDDVLFASRSEVAELVAGTGWTVDRFVDDGVGYVAVLEQARR